MDDEQSTPQPECLGRILVVDDEPNVVDLVVLMCTRSNYETDSASDACQALDLLKARTYDLVLSDLSMPGMSGLDLLIRIREQYPQLPVLIMTGFATVETAVDCFRNGAVDFFEKPIRLGELTNLLERCIALKKLAVALRGAHRTPGVRDEQELRHAAERLLGVRPAEGHGSALNVVAVARPADAHVYPYLVGGLLHDSLNTLWVLQAKASGLSELAQAGPEPGALQRTTVHLQTHLEHLSRVLKLLQAISREYYTTHSGAAHQAKAHVEEQLQNLRQTYPAIGIDASLPAAFNEVQLPMGLLAFMTGELLTNAARACAYAGTGEVKMAVEIETATHTLALECVDSGPGFPPDLLDRLAEGEIRPPVKLGTGGYGLYLMKEVVNRLQGTMLFSNVEPRGARVQILLPVGGANR